MTVTNIQKPTVTITAVLKPGTDLTWDEATGTWQTQSGTWDLPGAVITNVQKPTVTITSVPKPI